eukprot:scaffold540442_cov47-Prasinocladus_malaysianus.AAC.1
MLPFQGSSLYFDAVRRQVLDALAAVCKPGCGQARIAQAASIAAAASRLGSTPNRLLSAGPDKVESSSLASPLINSSKETML